MLKFRKGHWVDKKPLLYLTPLFNKKNLAIRFTLHFSAFTVSQKSSTGARNFWNERSKLFCVHNTNKRSVQSSGCVYCLCLDTNNWTYFWMSVFFQNFKILVIFLHLEQSIMTFVNLSFCLSVDRRWRALVKAICWPPISSMLVVGKRNGQVVVYID